MSTPVAELLASLVKAPEPLRSGAFHRLVHALWAPSPHDTGAAKLLPHAPAAVGALCACALHPETPEPDRIAFLLGLLAEVEREGEPGRIGPVRATIRPQLRSLLRLPMHHAATPPREGRLYLMTQFPEDETLIAAALSEQWGEEDAGVRAVRGAFALAGVHPRRAKSVVAYLGAEAAYGAGPDRETALRDTLACPECHGPLHLAPHALTCTRCARQYAWHGDVPSLLPEAHHHADEFPVARVAEYEQGTRPRFVRVMAGDFARAITPEAEAHYLRQQLRARDGVVLDLACGAGGWTQHVADVVGVDRVLALDFSMAMLQAVGKRLPRVLRVHGSASALPIRSAALGAINCSDALQALPDPAGALREAARCLRPGAPLTCFTMLEAPQPYAYFQARFPDNPRTCFSADGLAAMLREAGLQVTDWRQISYGVLFTAERPAA